MKFHGKRIKKDIENLQFTLTMILLDTEFGTEFEAIQR